MIRTIAVCCGFALMLGGCVGNETVAAYGAGDRVWQVEEINGVSFASTATLQFAEQGQIRGTGPCNSYTARMVAPYPWFDVAQITQTRKTCPDLADETRFLEALRDMTLSEVLADTMILSNDAGDSIILKSDG